MTEKKQDPLVIKKKPTDSENLIEIFFAGWLLRCKPSVGCSQDPVVLKTLALSDKNYAKGWALCPAKGALIYSNTQWFSKHC